MAGGRPTKYLPEYCEQAKNLIALGAKDSDIAKFFSVTIQTLFNWKAKHPEFLESVKLSKEQYDERVVRSLNEKALGYSCTETKVFNIDGELKTIEVEKHYPPSDTACIFWLKNRQPEQWRDVQHNENHHTTERDEVDDLDLARKLAYLLNKGDKLLPTQH